MSTDTLTKAKDILGHDGPLVEHKYLEAGKECKKKLCSECKGLLDDKFGILPILPWEQQKSFLELYWETKDTYDSVKSNFQNLIPNRRGRKPKLGGVDLLNSELTRIAKYLRQSKEIIGDNKTVECLKHVRQMESILNE